MLNSTNNLPPSHSHLHHAPCGGLASAYPGQHVGLHSLAPKTGKNEADFRPASEWLAPHNEHHLEGRPAPSVCGSDYTKSHGVANLTPLATPQQPFDKSKWDLGKRPPPGLTPFNGKRETFSAFHDRVRDRCGCANSGWKPLLDSIKARKNNRYTFQLISEDSWRGLTGDDLKTLSNELWNFLGFCVTDNVHRNRSATTRGETDNGFELWRKYCYDNSIGAASTETRTCDEFHSFGQCDKMQYLEKHILEWDNLRLQVAADLPDHHLRSKFCGILQT